MTDNDKIAIEEMASDIEQSGMLDSLSRCRIVAEELYFKGYRQQSEGEWRPYKTPLDARQTGWICSNCSSVVYDLSNGDTDFCPNCGARMGGGE